MAAGAPRAHWGGRARPRGVLLPIPNQHRFLSERRPRAGTMRTSMHGDRVSAQTVHSAASCRLCSHRAASRGQEVHLGRHAGEGRGQEDVEEEEPGLVRRARGAADARAQQAEPAKPRQLEGEGDAASNIVTQAATRTSLCTKGRGRGETHWALSYRTNTDEPAEQWHPAQPG